MWWFKTNGHIGFKHCHSFLSLLLRKTQSFLNRFYAGFPQTAVLQELLKYGSVPQGAALQGQTPAAWIPKGLQLLRDLRLHHRLSMGCSLFQGTFMFSSIGPFMDCEYLLQHGTPCWTCRGTAYSSMVPSRGSRGTSALVPGAPPPLPSSLTLVSVGLFLSHFITSFSQLLLCSSFFLFSYICSH